MNHRFPPHSLPSEQGILGCILLDPKYALPEVQSKPSLGAAFYDLRHTAILEAIVDVHGSGKPIEILTVQERLKAKSQLDSVGGLTYLSALPDIPPSVHNLPHYIGIVLEHYARREMIRLCGEITESAFDETKPPVSVADDAVKAIGTIGQSFAGEGTVSTHDLVKAVIDEMEQAVANQGSIPGLKTGFTEFDRMTGGLQPGDYVVIAARPSTGKSSFAMNIAEYVAVDLELPVGVFSLEMDAKRIIQRVLCGRSKVSLTHARDGVLTERDFPKLIKTASRLAKANLFIDDTAGLNVQQIAGRAKRWKQNHDIQLLIVDYFQLIACGNGRSSRDTDLAQVSQGLKNLGRQLKIPIIVLSQLNRDIEKDKNRKPRMSDLRETGALESDADVIGFLYKTEDSDPTGAADIVPVNFLIKKNRNGPVGEIYLTFHKTYTRFEAVPKTAGVPVFEPPNQYKDH